MRKCTRTRKIPYETIEVVRKALISYVTSNSQGDELFTQIRYYKCDFCEKYHLTSNNRKNEISRLEYDLPTILVLAENRFLKLVKNGMFGRRRYHSIKTGNKGCQFSVELINKQGLLAVYNTHVRNNKVHLFNIFRKVFIDEFNLTNSEAENFLREMLVKYLKLREDIVIINKN